MKSTKTSRVVAALTGCSTGLFLAVLAASPAAADPVEPTVPPAPVSADPAPPALATTVQSADTEAIPVPPNGVPHLASPDALPPGSTMVPQNNDSPNVSYLRDLWQAVQNHEISGKEALVMGLAQRGMNTPYPDQAPGPNVPTGPPDPVQVPAGAPALPAPPVPDGPPPPTP
jgi:hypothetical protein